MIDARTIAEETVRASYGRLLAWLSSRTRDVAAAEDALSDAFRAALETWPEKGIPNSPEAWLLTAARRKLIDGARRQKSHDTSAPALSLMAEEVHAAAHNDDPFPDERLKLLFICAHPAIDASVRSALMLQTVLGLDAARIASAFLVSPAAMSGRLVRAKRKIKTAGIPFTPPTPDELPQRLSAVFEAIYAAFGAGWDDLDGAGQESGDLTREAIFLARLVTDLAPNEPEGWGLLALMLHADARRHARRSNDAYIPLEDQDTALWDLACIQKAEDALAQAWRFSDPGPYQLEAAIQSAHAAGKLHSRDTRDDIVKLYERLLDLAPTVGGAVGYAAALSAAGRHEKGLAALDRVEQLHTQKYQAYWAVRAHILASLSKSVEASGAYDRAIGLTQDMAARTFLLQKKKALSKT